MEKKEFHVSMPFAGVCTLTVEAETEEQAIEQFYEDFNELKDGLNDVNAATEWDFYKTMATGNRRHYAYSDVNVEEE